MYTNRYSKKRCHVNVNVKVCMMNTVTKSRKRCTKCQTSITDNRSGSYTDVENAVMHANAAIARREVDV